VLDRLRAWVFPAACCGCDRPGSALCAVCAPHRADAIHFSVAGVPAFALGAYDGALREAILALKHGERDPIAAFAALLDAAPIDGTLVPLPTTRARAAQRGFDQSIAIARCVAERRAIPWAELLEKRGPPQAGRNRDARLRPAQRFRTKCGAIVPRRVSVFDDVCTTGGTLNDAVAALRQAGAEVCRVILLARKLEPEPRAVRAGP
jgi:predicted amidophosphoribosyltransferase